MKLAITSASDLVLRAIEREVVGADHARAADEEHLHDRLAAVAAGEAEDVLVGRRVLATVCRSVTRSIACSWSRMRPARSYSIAFGRLRASAA